VGSELPLVETDRRDPFIDQARVLPRAEMAEIVDPAREGAATFRTMRPARSRLSETPLPDHSDR